MINNIKFMSDTPETEKINYDGKLKSSLVQTIDTPINDLLDKVPFIYHKSIIQYFQTYFENSAPLAADFDSDNLSKDILSLMEASLANNNLGNQNMVTTEQVVTEESPLFIYKNEIVKLVNEFKSVLTQLIDYSTNTQKIDIKLFSPVFKSYAREELEKMITAIGDQEKATNLLIQLNKTENDLYKIELIKLNSNIEKINDLIEPLRNMPVINEWQKSQLDNLLVQKELLVKSINLENINDNAKEIFLDRNLSNQVNKFQGEIVQSMITLKGAKFSEEILANIKAYQQEITNNFGNKSAKELVAIEEQIRDEIQKAFTDSLVVKRALKAIGEQEDNIIELLNHKNDTTLETIKSAHEIINQAIKSIYMVNFDNNIISNIESDLNTSNSSNKAILSHSNKSAVKKSWDLIVQAEDPYSLHNFIEIEEGISTSYISELTEQTKAYQNSQNLSGSDVVTSNEYANHLLVRNNILTINEIEYLNYEIATTLDGFTDNYINGLHELFNIFAELSGGNRKEGFDKINLINYTKVVALVLSENFRNLLKNKVFTSEDLTKVDNLDIDRFNNAISKLYLNNMIKESHTFTDLLTMSQCYRSIENNITTENVNIEDIKTEEQQFLKVVEIFSNIYEIKFKESTEAKQQALNQLMQEFNQVVKNEIKLSPEHTNNLIISVLMNDNLEVLTNLLAISSIEIVNVEELLMAGIKLKKAEFIKSYITSDQTNVNDDIIQKLIIKSIDLQDINFIKFFFTLKNDILDQDFTKIMISKAIELQNVEIIKTIINNFKFKYIDDPEELFIKSLYCDNRNIFKALITNTKFLINNSLAEKIMSQALELNKLDAIFELLNSNIITEINNSEIVRELLLDAVENNDIARVSKLISLSKSKLEADLTEELFLGAMNITNYNKNVYAYANNKLPTKIIELLLSSDKISISDEFANELFLKGIEKMNANFFIEFIHSNKININSEIVQKGISKIIESNNPSMLDAFFANIELIEITKNQNIIKESILKALEAQNLNAIKIILDNCRIKINAETCQEFILKAIDSNNIAIIKLLISNRKIDIDNNKEISKQFILKAINNKDHNIVKEILFSNKINLGNDIEVSKELVSKSIDINNYNVVRELLTSNKINLGNDIEVSKELILKAINNNNHNIIGEMLFCYKINLDDDKEISMELLLEAINTHDNKIIKNILESRQISLYFKEKISNDSILKALINGNKDVFTNLIKQIIYHRDYNNEYGVKKLVKELISQFNSTNSKIGEEVNLNNTIDNYLIMSVLKNNNVEILPSLLEAISKERINIEELLSQAIKLQKAEFIQSFISNDQINIDNNIIQKLIIQSIDLQDIYFMKVFLKLNNIILDQDFTKILISKTIEVKNLEILNLIMENIKFKNINEPEKLLLKALNSDNTKIFKALIANAKIIVNDIFAKKLYAKALELNKLDAIYELLSSNIITEIKNSEIIKELLLAAVDNNDIARATKLLSLNESKIEADLAEELFIRAMNITNYNKNISVYYKLPTKIIELLLFSDKISITDELANELFLKGIDKTNASFSIEFINSKKININSEVVQKGISKIIESNNPSMLYAFFMNQNLIGITKNEHVIKESILKALEVQNLKAIEIILTFNRVNLNEETCKEFILKAMDSNNIAVIKLLISNININFDNKEISKELILKAIETNDPNIVQKILFSNKITLNNDKEISMELFLKALDTNDNQIINQLLYNKEINLDFNKEISKDLILKALSTHDNHVMINLISKMIDYIDNNKHYGAEKFVEEVISKFNNTQSEATVEVDVNNSIDNLLHYIYQDIVGINNNNDVY